MNKNDKLLQSIRVVGIIKPVFDQQTQNFAPPALTILGTGFWVDSSIFVTCAHVVATLLNAPLELGGMLIVG